MYPVIHFLNRMDRGFKKVLSVSDPYPYPHKLSGLNPVNGHPVPSPSLELGLGTGWLTRIFLLSAFGSESV